MALGAPEQDGYGDDPHEDGAEVGVIFEWNRPGHVRPETTYVNHGAILRGRIADIPPGKWIDSAYTTYRCMGPMLYRGFTFNAVRLGGADATIRTNTGSIKAEYNDQDILDGFGPSRVPPRIAFKLKPARGAIEREIADLLKAKPNEPPAMMEVDLNDARFRQIPEYTLL